MSDSPDSLTNSPQSSRGNLPALLTSCIGRECERSELKQVFSTTRLLTLTGIGGIGKTRLALQVAHDLAQSGDSFPGGIWFVSIAHLHDSTEILPALAQTLGLPQGSEQARTSALYRFLHAKKALLILDGCEHLIEACSRRVEILLHSFPNLCFFLTSRETLDISGETVYTLPPLSLPIPSPTLTPEDLLQASSAVLFLERARSVLPAFRVTDQNMSALVVICQHLDGVPLALELAANKLRIMSVEQIAEQVAGRSSERFKLLVNGSRTVLPHQQSLRATLDWSYALLTVAEQRLLQRLAVFSGGWTLEAAQVVCADAEMAGGSILDGLTRLVHASLVQVDRKPVAQALANGEVGLVEHGRYRLLESVQRYALEKLLASGEQQTVQQKHLTYFLALAEKAEPALRGASQLPWLVYLDQEHENLCRALEYAHQQHLDEIGLRLANALWWYWILRARFVEGRAWLEEVVLLDVSIPATLRALTFYRAGMLAFFQGDLERLDVLTERSLAIFNLLQETQGMAMAQSNLVHVALRQGNHERAEYLGTTSVALAHSVGDSWYLAIALLPLAILRIRQQDYSSAGVLLSEALQLFRTLGDRWGIAYTLDTLGQLADAQRDSVSCLACYEQSLKLFEHLHDTIGTARALLHMGFHLLNQGKDGRAASALEESLKLCRASQRRIGTARALLGLGRIKLRSGDLQEAALLLEEGLEIFREHGDVRGFAEALKSLQEVACQQDQQIKRFLQHSLGKRYHINNALDMVASLEAIAASERTQALFAGRMRPAGWLKCVIDCLQETRQPFQAEEKVSMGWVREIVEEQGAVSAPFSAQTRLKEPTFALLSHSFSTQDTSASSADRTPVSLFQTGKQFLPATASILTRREQEVLYLVAYGLSNAQIAQRLIISVGTVRTHLASIYHKLGVASRTAAVHCARELRLLS
jgi:predicted ATPase/DNA-binding CsgD family transcriptional regulator